MKLKVLVFNTLTLILLAISFALPVSAQYGQYGGYGGAPVSVSAILVDKLVGKPTTDTKGAVTSTQFVDNLSANDFKFRPGQEVLFQVKVKNTSNNVVTNVVVRDNLPQFLDPKEGPGTFDAATRSISINVGTLNPGEEKILNVMKLQVPAQDKLPADQRVFCMTNGVEATADNNLRDDDFTQFCVEREVGGAPGVSVSTPTTVTTIPSAGPEMGLLLLAGEFLALGAGLYIKKTYLP